MQLFQDNKSSNDVGDDSAQSRDMGQSNSSDRPSRELMRLVFPDGTVRTVDPEVDND